MRDALTPLGTPRPRAVLLDAGFTLTFIDHHRVAGLAAAAGLTVAADALLMAEPLIRRELTTFGWATTPTSNAGKAGGPAFYRRLLELAGATGQEARVAQAADAIWSSHLERNVWSRIGDGVDAALSRLSAGGLALAVVSNSEGTVEAMLTEVGLRRHFATVVDSWHVGVSKPDPRIFQIALDRLGVPAHQAIMVGDTPAADVAGARAAGIAAALLDPLDLYPDADVPRFTNLLGFVAALLP